MRSFEARCRPRSPPQYRPCRPGARHLPCPRRYRRSTRSVRSTAAISVPGRATRSRRAAPSGAIGSSRSRDHRAATRAISTGTVAIYVCGAREAVSNCCRCRPMSGQPSPPIYRSGRPASHDRHRVPAIASADPRPDAGSDAIGSIVRSALERAGVNAPHRGSHQFRHALAVNMLQQRCLVGGDRGSPSSSKPADHLDLRSSRYQRFAVARPAVAGRCAMNTLREALQEYVTCAAVSGSSSGMTPSSARTVCRVHGRAPSSRTSP